MHGLPPPGDARGVPAAAHGRPVTRAAGRAAGVLASLALAHGDHPAAAQGFRASFDLRGQSVATRGWLLDSMPRGRRSAGRRRRPLQLRRLRRGLQRAHLVLLLRAGPEGAVRADGVHHRRDGVGTGNARGLSAHLNFRMNANAGDEPFPRTEPAFQFWEGYLSYQHDWFAVIAGRQTFTSRLGSPGSTAAGRRVRYRKLGLEATGYVGLGPGASQLGRRQRPGHRPARRLHPRRAKPDRRRARGLGERPGGGARPVAAPGGPLHRLPHVRFPLRQRRDPSAAPVRRRGRPRLRPGAGLGRQRGRRSALHRAARLGHRGIQAVHAALRPLDASGRRSRRCRGTACRRLRSSRRCAGSSCGGASSGTSTRTRAPKRPWAAPHRQERCGRPAPR